MSGERPSRTPKRPVYDDAPVPDDNQDALVMLVSFFIPVPVMVINWLVSSVHPSASRRVRYLPLYHIWTPFRDPCFSPSSLSSDCIP